MPRYNAPSEEPSIATSKPPPFPVREARELDSVREPRVRWNLLSIDSNIWYTLVDRASRPCGRAMEPTRQLIDEIYRDKVLRARRMPAAEKLFAGRELFDFGCIFTRAGIQNQNPGADEERVSEMLRERLALQRRLENRR